LEEIVSSVVPMSRWLPWGGEDTGFGIWEDASGAALWIQIEEGSVTGAHPFFSPAAQHSLRLEAADAGGLLDGSVRAFILPDERTLLPFDVLNFPTVAEALRPQTVARARVAAFAESLTLWPSEGAYRSGDEGQRKARSIAPTGLFPPEKGGTGRSTARIAGVVRSAERRENALTHAAFLSLRLETAGVTLDAVAADGPLPVPGAVADGHFWLAAVAEPPSEHTS
jgi:hypothetical protein